MPLFSDPGAVIVPGQLTRPGQTVGSTDINSQAITEYGGHVEHTIERRSVLQHWIPWRSVRGTNSVTNYAVGKSVLQKVVPGEAPAANPQDFSKANLTIDTVINARNAIPLLETFQTSYDARKEVGVEHGIEIAKFVDQSLFIQAAKAATATESKFSNGQAGRPSGHFGGSTVVLSAAGDRADPAKLYKAVKDLTVKFQQKDVDPGMEDMMLALTPGDFATLSDADQIVRRDFITSDGNTFRDQAIFKATGVPVVMSNNVPQTNITGHYLSNTGNGNAYDGNFTKLVGLMFSAKALLAGETIPLTSDVFYDKIFKTWFVDSHLSFGVTTYRHEYAGAILLP